METVKLVYMDPAVHHAFLEDRHKEFIRKQAFGDFTYAAPIMCLFA